MNLTDDGMVGQQVFAGEATRLAYMTDEAKEGRDAFLEKRKPNFDKKWLPQKLAFCFLLFKIIRNPKTIITEMQAVVPKAPPKPSKK